MSGAPSESNPAKMLKSMLVAGAAAVTAFAAFAAAPAILAERAEAQRIVAPAVAPPGGAPGSFADLIQRVSPAVVSISVRQKANAERRTDLENLPPGLEEFMRRFPERGPARQPTALGSGFIIAENGTIVTNHHVVEDAEEIDIRMSDGRELKAELVGTDPGTDLAVLRIKGGGRFPYVTLDRTPGIRVGDWVVAVGNPFGLDGTATAGIISAKGRRDYGNSSYVDFIQIDAPINRGNSGGPAFDLKGNVIGVNSAIFSPTGGNVGIGFAIPSDTAARIVDQLIATGRVTRGWLGVQVQGMTDDLARSLGLARAEGVIVAEPQAGSPAARAGIRSGDVIVAVDGHPVNQVRDLTRRIAEIAPGANARLDILRSGRRETLTVTIGRLGEDAQRASLAPAEERGPKTGATSDVLDRLGMELTGGRGGVAVSSLNPNGAAARRGLREGDIILEVAGEAVARPEDVAARIDAARADGRASVLARVRTGTNVRFVPLPVDRS